MHLEDFYRSRGGDYREMIRRFRTEDRILRYLHRIEEDCSLTEAEEALKAGHADEAFRLVHSLKGACMNLGLADLLDCAGGLAELLRPFSEGDAIIPQETAEEAWKELEAVREVYEQIKRDLANMENPG